MTIAQLAGWINPIEISLILLGVGYVVMYWFNIFPRFNKFATPLRAIYFFIASLVFIAIFKSVLQYMTWMNDDFGKLLLPPHQSWMYFAIYAGGRFWLGMILGVVSASLLYVTLRTYVRMRGVQISNEHLLIACLCALLVGWPRFVFLVPLALALAVLLTILNMLIFKKNEVPFNPAFIIGAVIALFYGVGVLNAIGLSVLTV